MRLLKIATACFMILLPISDFKSSATEENQFDMQKILQGMSDSFRKKIDEQYSLIAQFTVTDLNETWSVIIRQGRNITIQKGEHEQAEYFFKADAETFERIYKGEMTALTAAGKAKGSDVSPLEVDIAENLDFSKEKNKLFTFIQQFFNKSFPEKILLGKKYSRVIHGGHAIPLYYYEGLRSAWYMIKQGERLNEIGDTNPFPQSFIFIEGEGFAKIGSDTVRVKAGESYYIPPNSDHVVWNENEQPLILIFLAWGEGA
jgi:mannose-6-phosphate isomerase-like protein (cupin superfamily)/putative sterol carrier protein